MRVLSVFLGLLLGLVAGVVLVAWNPLAWSRGLAALPADVAPRHAYSGDNFRGMAGDLADLLGTGLKRGRQESGAGGGPLRGATLAGVRIGIVRLPSGGGGPAALAVKVSVIDASNALWRAQLGTDDYWNIFWPGEGSVFAAGYSNAWPIVRDRLLSLAGLDGRLQEYALSAPPPAGAWTGVIGASGRYAGDVGEIREWQTAVANQATGLQLDRAMAIKVVPPPVVTQ